MDNEKQGPGHQEDDGDSSTFSGVEIVILNGIKLSSAKGHCQALTILTYGQSNHKNWLCTWFNMSVWNLSE